VASSGGENDHTLMPRQKSNPHITCPDRNRAYLHDRMPITLRHGDALLILESHTPYSITLRDELANKMTSLQVPDLNSAITATADNAGVVKLQTRNTIVVRGQPMYRREFFERPHTDRAVGASGYQRSSAHL
jgi:hypothetical protein